MKGLQRGGIAGEISIMLFYDDADLDVPLFLVFVGEWLNLMELASNVMFN